MTDAQAPTDPAPNYPVPPPDVRQDAVRSGDVDWHPEIWGWSSGIHEFYTEIASMLPQCAQCVELGVYYGRSILYLMTKLHQLGKHARLIGVDPGDFPGSYKGLLANVQVIRRELSSRPTGAYAHDLVSVELWRETGSEVLHLVPDGSCDMVFVDADHSEAAVRLDIQQWLPKVKAGGVIAGHDYGQPDIPGVAKAVDDLLPGRFIHPGTVWSYRKP
jgi:hypothetical protein